MNLQMNLINLMNLDSRHLETDSWKLSEIVSVC